MTTRNKITEQIERLYMRSYDREDLKPKVERREIALLVDQVANELLATEPQQTARIGIVDIPTCMIATYTGQVVTETETATGNVYTVPLPAFPIRLPMDMGVWAIVPENPIEDPPPMVLPSAAAYIPIKTDFWDLLGTEDEGLLEDQIGFYVEGRGITFTAQPTDTVKIKLLIVDPSLLGEYDPYPVSADIESKIIQSVVTILHSRGLAPEKPKG